MYPEPCRKQQLNNTYWSIHSRPPCWASASWHGAPRTADLEAASSSCQKRCRCCSCMSRPDRAAAVRDRGATAGCGNETPGLAIHVDGRVRAKALPFLCQLLEPGLPAALMQGRPPNRSWCARLAAHLSPHAKPTEDYITDRQQDLSRIP